LKFAAHFDQDQNNPANDVAGFISSCGKSGEVQQ